MIIRKWLIFLAVHDEPQQLAAAQNKMIVADLGVDYCSIRVAASKSIPLFLEMRPSSTQWKIDRN